MEGKVLSHVFGIRKHEDRTGHSLLAFYQPPRGVDITQLSKEFNKHSGSDNLENAWKSAFWHFYMPVSFRSDIRGTELRRYKKRHTQFYEKD